MLIHIAHYHKNLMKSFFKSIIPCSKNDIMEVLKKQEYMIQYQKDILERLCNLEHTITDGKMKEVLERLSNIEEEMIVRMSHIEEKEEDIIKNIGSSSDRKIRIKLFGSE